MRGLARIVQRGTRRSNSVRRRLTRNAVLAAAGVAALSTIVIGSSSAYFTGAAVTGIQTATVGSYLAPSTFTASKVSVSGGSSGTRTDLVWSDQTAAGAIPSDAKYTLDRSATGTFDDPSAVTRVATDTTSRAASDTAGAVATGSWRAQQVEPTLLQQATFSLMNGRVFYNGSLYKEATSTSLFLSVGVPTEITGWAAEVKEISAGRDHVCGLLVTGKVQCWGYNGSGQLGDGTLTDSTISSAPVSLSDVGNVFQGKTVIGVDAGMSFTCAWTADGTIGCWGLNNYGQLGNAGVTGALSTTPVIVDAAKNAAGTTLSKVPITFVTAAEFHACAVRGAVTAANGTVTTPSNEETVVCWGRNNWKQLGANVTQNSSARNYTPTAVKDTNNQFTGITAIASGEAVTCVVNDKTATANIACWGGGGLGVLGDGVGHEEALPTAITSTGRGFTGVALGVWHGCGVSPTQYTCWGTNQRGQLGNNASTGNNNIFAPQGPYSIAKFLGVKAGAITSVGVAWLHTCVTTADGSMACWGLNDNKQLGQNSSTTDLSIPTAVIQNIGTSGSPVYSPMRPRLLGSGTDQNTVGFINGSVWRWGSSPAAVAGWPSDLTSLTASGSDRICGVSAVQGVMCGGTYNSWGQLGNGSTTDASSQTPTRVSDPDGVLAGKTVIDIAAGSTHTCALADDGTIGCWGGNNSGQLGVVGSTTNSTKVVAVTNYQGNLTGAARKPLRIDAGSNFTCATTASALICWGDNRYGQLARTTSDVFDSAAQSTAGSLFASGVRSLSAGYETACAIAIGDGKTYCWGTNNWGQVGNGAPGSAVTSATALTATTTVFQSIYTTGNTTCGWTGSAFECWGYAGTGVSGRSPTSNSYAAPAAIADPNGVLRPGVDEVYPGYEAICVLTRLGGVACWGSSSGNGTGTSSHVYSPTVIAAVPGAGGSAPACRDAAVLLTDGKNCSLSPNIAYTYRLTYTVPGITNWKSANGLVTR